MHPARTSLTALLLLALALGGPADLHAQDDFETGTTWSEDGSGDEGWQDEDASYQDEDEGVGLEEEPQPEEELLGYDYEVFSVDSRIREPGKFLVSVVVGNLGTEAGPGAELALELEVPEGLEVKFRPGATSRVAVEPEGYQPVDFEVEVVGLTPETEEELGSLIGVVRNRTPDDSRWNDEADVDLLFVAEEPENAGFSRFEARMVPGTASAAPALDLDVEMPGSEELRGRLVLQVASYAPEVQTLVELELGPAEAGKAVARKLRVPLPRSFCGQLLDAYVALAAVEIDPETEEELVQDGATRDIQVQVTCAGSPGE